MCKPQAAAARPTIKARTTGTNGLFTLILGLAGASGGGCSSADGFSDMNFFHLSFREIIPKSNYIPQTRGTPPSELKGYFAEHHKGIREKCHVGPPGRKTSLTNILYLLNSAS
jgi:hypothetical protein